MKLIRSFRLVLTLVFSFASQPGFATEIGKEAAMKYFTGQSRKPATVITQNRAEPDSEGVRSLSLALGGLVQTKSYGWADESMGGWSGELAYQSQTEYFRTGYALDFQKFVDDEQELSKLAFLFSVSFPRRLTFPVYIGASVGPGYFLKQKRDESELTLDYKGYMGLRLSQNNNLFFLEGGVKNHLNVLTDGQFIGWFVSSGVAYRF